MNNSSQWRTSWPLGSKPQKKKPAQKMETISQNSTSTTESRNPQQAGWVSLNSENNVAIAWNTEVQQQSQGSTSSISKEPRAGQAKLIRRTSTEFGGTPSIEEELSNQSLYKTELCRSWKEFGTCRYGHKCQFAHGEHELRLIMRHPRYKTEPCKTYSAYGFCPYGNRCRFIHPEVSIPRQRSNSMPTTFYPTDQQSQQIDEESSDPNETEEPRTSRLAFFQTISAS